jgi:hypothetical protein
MRGRADVYQVQIPHNEDYMDYCPRLCPTCYDGPCWATRTTYTTESRTRYFLDSTEQLGDELSKSFSDPITEPTVSEWDISRPIRFFFDKDVAPASQYLYWFNSGKSVFEFRIPLHQPVVSSFLANCKSPSPDQQALMKKIDEEALAAKKVAEERRIAEEERLAKAREAEEQARIAKEKATAALVAKVAADNAARIKRRSDAITQFCGSPQSTVNASSLASLLAAHTALATVDMGYRGIAQNPMMINGRPEQLPVKTEIFPDGHIKYRIEAGVFHTDAARYSTYKSLVLYRFDKVEAKSDSLEIRLPVKNNPDPKEYAVLKLMFDKGWQSTMTSEQVIETIEKYLSID